MITSTIHPFILLTIITLIKINNTPCYALENGYGLLPGMGWNSDYCTNCTGTPSSSGNGFGGERFVHHIATFLNTSGFQRLGYKFVNMDASWDLAYRDHKTGNLLPDPQLWPSGIEKTINFVHSLNLGFGLYGDKGTLDCAKHPGSYGHEVQDANYLASIGVDWWKEDSCYSKGTTHQEEINNYAKMRDALNATKRKIWFALCGWQTFYATDPSAGQSLGNSWRIGPDTGTGWSAVMINTESGLQVAKSNVPGPSLNGGAWSDGSLLLNPGMGKSEADMISNARHRSMFSLWCILGFNLLMTGNLSALDPYVIETWSNPDMIAINQDIKGYQPFRADNDSKCFHSSNKYCNHDDIVVSEENNNNNNYVQARLEECGGEPELQMWEQNVPSNGFWKNLKSNVCLNVQDCKSEIIYDACRTTDPSSSCSGEKTPFLNEEFDLIVVNNNNNKRLMLQSRLTNIGYKSNNDSTHGCIASQGASGLLNLVTCSNTSAAQMFRYDAITKQLTSYVDGRCLTGPTANPPSSNNILVIGRHLYDGKTALLMLNNNNKTGTITCDKKCFTKLGIMPSKSNPLNVRDLWLHVDLKPITEPFLSQLVEGNGGSVVLRLN